MLHFFQINLRRMLHFIFNHIFLFLSPPYLPCLSCYNTSMSELRHIPNVGEQTEKDLTAMGYTTLESLKGKKAEDLYREECALRGVEIDRCQLYLYRAVEYFVNTEKPDPEKCKWWLWKDDFVEPSPCGAVCAECDHFPGKCGGCPDLPCSRFVNDPTVSEEENAANLKKMLERLAGQPDSRSLPTEPDSGK